MITMLVLLFCLMVNDRSWARDCGNYFGLRQPGKNQCWNGSNGITARGYAIFHDEAFAVRAVIVILRDYQLRKKATNLYKMMIRYAPYDDGNDPWEYAELIAGKLGIKPRDPIALFDEDGWIRDRKILTEILKTIARKEEGIILKNNLILDGLRIYEKEIAMKRLVNLPRKDRFFDLSYQDLIKQRRSNAKIPVLRGKVANVHIDSGPGDDRHAVSQPVDRSDSGQFHRILHLLLRGSNYLLSQLPFRGVGHQGESALL